MISNFIAHQQRSDYAGEKFNRPHRQAVQAARERHEALRAAQLANMRSHPSAGLPPPGQESRE